jgi:hypothetical protein
VITMRRTLLLFVVAFVLAVLGAPSCEVYEAPPEPSLPESVSNLLPDPSAPLVVRFSKPIDERTLHLKVARNLVDPRGRLADEWDPPRDLSLIFSHGYDEGDTGGDGILSADKTTFTITPTAAFPINPELVLIVEPGLHAIDSDVTINARRKLRFGYQFDLTCNAPTKIMPAKGSYFVLIDVKQPIGTQVRLWADFRVDTSTGRFSAEFIRAGRNLDGSRCPGGCASTDACRTLPGPPACVVPSLRADDTNEYPDFIADDKTAASFRFTATGCIVDSPDGSAQFVNLPVDIFVSSPQVTLRNTRLTSSFARDAQGVLRGAGSLSADDVSLGPSSSGKGAGTLTAILVADSEAPTNIPAPPPVTP